MNTYLETGTPREGEPEKQERYPIEAILSHTTLSESIPNSRDVTLAALHDEDPVHIVDYQALDPMLRPNLVGTNLVEFQGVAEVAATISRNHLHTRLLGHHFQFIGLAMVFGDGLSAELDKFSDLPDFIPYATWRLAQQSQLIQTQS